MTNFFFIFFIFYTNFLYAPFLYKKIIIYFANEKDCKAFKEIADKTFENMLCLKSKYDFKIFIRFVPEKTYEEIETSLKNLKNYKSIDYFGNNWLFNKKAKS